VKTRNDRVESALKIKKISKVSPKVIVYGKLSSEIIGLFCRISSLLFGSFAKETYKSKEPTNRSHLVN